MKKYLACFLALIMAISLIPHGLFTIDVRANTETVTSGTTGDCTWTLDGTVLTISGNGAMASQNLNNVILPWGTDITEAIIESGVTIIGGGAFYNCKSLKSVTISDTVEGIQLAVFQGCSALTSISVSKDNLNYSSEDGVLFNKDKTTLITYPAGKYGAYTIPDSVVTINSLWSFENCNGLTSITIPDSVTSIASSTFNGCNNLTSVIIPKSITINAGAFSGCYNLKSVGYAGSESDRNNMTIGSYNDYLLNATWYYNYCGEDAHTYTDGCDMDCNTCQWPRIGEHTYDNSLDKDCNLCAHARTFEEFPIVSISAEPITVVEGTNGSWSYTYDNGKRTNAYFWYFISPNYTIAMSDGLTFTGKEHDIHLLFGQFPRANTSQSYENQWSVGTQTIPISIGNITGQFTLTITESPIASISAAPITLYEGANGSITHDYSTNTDYYHYSYDNLLTLVVFYKNGTVKTVTSSDRDDTYYPSINDEQSAADPWGLGTHTATAHYGHLSCAVDITIAPNPIENIELIKLPKTEYITGEYFDLSGAIIRAHFSDGTSEDISIPHYFTYPNHTQYFCNKVKASDMITVSSGLARDAAPGAFTTAGEQVLTLTYFGQSTTLPVTVTEKTIKDISINDGSKNLVVTVTYTDNTVQKMTALSFISGCGDAGPGYVTRDGELRTDKGIYNATFTTFDDGSRHLSMNGVTSNILENGCDWYSLYIDRYNLLYSESYSNMASNIGAFNGIITADNIDSIICYILLLEEFEWTESDPHWNGNYWYYGQDLRDAILKHFAVDSVDLSLSSYYDSEKDLYPCLGTGDVGYETLPATLTYENGYWEACWPMYYSDEASSYAHFDDAGRILRFSAGAPITEPVVQIGDAEYDSFEEALNAAVAGQTITLNADVVATETCTVVNAGVTLDLNGHNLTVSNFITFGDAVDSTEGGGKLIISDDTKKAFTNLQDNNKQMPLYDEDGYRFFTYSVMSKGAVTVTEGEKIKFGTHIQLSNRKAYELLGNGKNGNTAITFTVAFGDQSFDYTFKSATMAKYSQAICAKYDANIADKTGTVMVLTVSGLSQLSNDRNLTVTVRFHSTNTIVTSTNTSIQ